MTHFQEAGSEEMVSHKTKMFSQQDYAQQIVDAVSHDLRNPTRQIKSFLQILQNHSGLDIDEEGLLYLNLALQAADTLQAKLDALTILSNAATSDLNAEAWDASELIEKAIVALDALIGELDATVEVKASAKVVADRNHLVSVFTELIANSLKFCDKPVLIQIAAEVSGDDCIFTVTDSGPGFEARDLTAPFNLFRRFHLDHREGTGTGLTVVRTLLLRQGALPTIESNPDSGTTVSFALPLA